MKRHSILSLLFSACLVGANAANAQTSADNWPSRPITLIVPSSAGGTSDITARIVAEHVSKTLGQPIVIENRPGASNTSGPSAALRARADGYTFATGSPSSMILAPLSMEDLSYKQSDFQPVSGLTINEMVMNVNAALPITNPKELVAWAKQQNKATNFGSYGIGSYPHIVANILGIQNKFAAVHIPYKAEQEMILGTARGDIAYSISVMPTGKKMQDTGRTRVIGVLSPKRSPLQPEIPTFMEMGFTDPAFQLLGWGALYAPKGVPQPIIKKMEQAMLEALNSDDVRQKMQAVYSIPWAAPAKEVDGIMKKETVIYRDLLKAADIETQ